MNQEWNDSMIAGEENGHSHNACLQAVATALLLGENAGLGAQAEVEHRKAGNPNRSLWCGAGNVVYLADDSVDLLAEAQSLLPIVKKYSHYEGDGFTSYYLGNALSEYEGRKHTTH